MTRSAVLLLALSALSISRPALAQGTAPPAPAILTLPTAPPPSTTPAAPSAPQPIPQIPWANKFFLPDIAQNPSQIPPAMIAWDFKDVPHGTLCSHTFTITNVYDEPMQIVEVRKSCHCLDYVPMPQLLRPNETGQFTVTMNTGKFVGHNAQTLYITFGPKYISTAVLKLSATSKADVTLSPGAIAFGTVSLGSTRSESVEIEYRGGKLKEGNKTKEWKIQGVQATAAPLDVKVNEVKKGLNLGLFGGPPKFRVDVMLKANAPPGPISEQISLTTNDSSNPVVQVMVTGTVQAPLEVSPASVHFDGIVANQVATQRVMVRAGKPFRILQVEGQDEVVSVDLPPIATPLPVHVLTVKFRPAQPGTVTRVLRLQTDLDGKVTVNLPVNGEGTK